jgi:hypothetical protein
LGDGRLGDVALVTERHRVACCCWILAIASVIIIIIFIIIVRSKMLLAKPETHLPWGGRAAEARNTATAPSPPSVHVDERARAARAQRPRAI